MSLTNTKIQLARPAAKSYKLTDDKGLFLLITPRGGKYWRFKYRLANIQKERAIGVHPDASLATAREKRDEARILFTYERRFKCCKESKNRGESPIKQYF